MDLVPLGHKRWFHWDFLDTIYNTLKVLCGSIGPTLPQNRGLILENGTSLPRIISYSCKLYEEDKDRGST